MQKLTDHMINVINTRGDYTWECACGAESSGSWHGDRNASTRHAVVDARDSGHRGGVAFIGYTLAYEDAVAVTR